MEKQKNLLKRVIIGVLCGFINGFFGGGGGMVVVPMLISLLGFNQKQAHASSIAIILPISLASAIVYLSNVEVDLKILLLCVLGVFIGGIIGAKLLKRASNKVIAYLFCGIMLFAGIRMLF